MTGIFATYGQVAFSGGERRLTRQTKNGPTLSVLPAGGLAGRSESPLVAHVRTSSGTGRSLLVKAVALAAAAAAETTTTKTAADDGAERTIGRLAILVTFSEHESRATEAYNLR
jgi:hypothetical protein